MSSDLRAALESALMEDPDDLAAHMAYGDHLAEQGDPRGEFIQVQLALEDAALPAARRADLQKREADLLHAHQAGWLGPLAKAMLKTDYTEYQLSSDGTNRCRWDRGWLSEVRLWRLELAEARALRDCRAARLLRGLDVWFNSDISPDEEDEDLGIVPDDGFPSPREADTSPLVVLHRAPFLPHLRSLRVGQPVNFDRGRYNSRFTSALGLVGLLERTAIRPAELFGEAGRPSRLEELHVLAKSVDFAGLFALDLPALRTLLLYHGSEPYPLGLLAGHRGLPALETLRIHPAHSFTEESPFLRRAEVAAFLRSPHFPALRGVHLHGSDMGDAGCRDLVESGVLKRLKVLDLRHGCVGDAGARALASCPDVRRLERLDLRHNELSAEGIAAVKALPIETECGDQNVPGEDAYLYSGDME
jgi:uncharacterized protein (TIGR02996 family)